MIRLHEAKFSSNLLRLIFIGCMQTWILSEAHPSAGFQLACSEKAPCNSTMGLVCTSGKCACINPETMKFNEEESKCEVIAGKPCLIENPVSLTGTLLEAPREKKLPCMKNSGCDENSRVCVCNDAFKFRKNECVTKSTFGEECFSSAECKDSEGLICVNNSCTCDPEKGTLIKHDGVFMCVGKPGQLCVEGLCVDGAECVPEISTTRSSYSSKDGTSSPSKSQICQCSPDTFPTRNGTCSRGFGVVCDDIQPCKSWLVCEMDGFCACRYGKTYDQRLDTCVATVGSPCNKNVTVTDSNPINEDEVICVTSADCMPNVGPGNQTSSYESPYHCVCKYGYHPAHPQQTCSPDNYDGKGLQPEGIIVFAAIVILILVGVGSIVGYCCLKKKGQALANAFG